MKYIYIYIYIYVYIYIPGVPKKWPDFTMSYLQTFWIWGLQIFYSDLAWVEIVYWKIWCDYLMPLKFCWYLKISKIWAPWIYWILWGDTWYNLADVLQILYFLPLTRNMCPSWLVAIESLRFLQLSNHWNLLNWNIVFFHIQF